MIQLHTLGIVDTKAKIQKFILNLVILGKLPSMILNFLHIIMVSFLYACNVLYV